MAKKKNDSLNDVSFESVLDQLIGVEENRVIPARFKVPFASLTLMDIFAGGISSGGRYVIGGPGGHGKTTTALMMVEAWTASGRNAIYIDAEDTLYHMGKMRKVISANTVIAEKPNELRQKNGHGWVYWFNCVGITKAQFLKAIGNLVQVTDQPFLFVFDSLNKIPLQSVFSEDASIEENASPEMGLRIALEKKAMIEALDSYAKAAGGQHVFVFLAQASARMKVGQDYGYDWKIAMPYAISHMVTETLIMPLPVFVEPDGVSVYTYRQQRVRAGIPNREPFKLYAKPDPELGFIYEIFDETAAYGKKFGLFVNKNGELIDKNEGWYYKGIFVARGQDGAAAWLAEKENENAFIEIYEACKTILQRC